MSDAGLDYTHRPNKIAHHVALEMDEITDSTGGPAYAMAQDGFLMTEWDGETRILPSGRLPDSTDRPPRVCKAWGQVTGNPGWAGVVAESIMASSRPQSLVFQPGTEVLPLMVELLSLLPAKKRWETTFSTYFTRLPAGVEWQLRFLLEGTKGGELPAPQSAYGTDGSGQPEGRTTRRRVGPVGQ